MADQQLSVLHKEIMAELQTEVMEDSYNRDPKSAADTKALTEASASQIEGLKLMLHNFEHKVRAIEQIALSKKSAYYPGRGGEPMRSTPLPQTSVGR